MNQSDSETFAIAWKWIEYLCKRVRSFLLLGAKSNILTRSKLVGAILAQHSQCADTEGHKD
jgi:hypothetical protein